MTEQETNGHSEEVALTINDAVSEGIRLGLATELGQTGFNSSDETLRRNLYENFGWPRDDLDGWDEDNWLALYLRNAYAKVVNDKPALTTWRDDPQVSDTDGPDASAFEETLTALDRQHDLWSYCERVDRAAGIGQHGLLLVGFRDVTTGDGFEAWSEDASETFDSPDAVTGFKPLLEAQIEDINYGGIDSERWGKPTEYTIDLSDDIDEETEDDPLTSLRVHHSRVVDVPARPPLDDDVLARPRVEPVLNNIIDIEKTLGAAAEAAYRAADYGLHLNADPEKVDLSQGADQLETELQKYEQDLQRYIRTQGMDVTRLGGDIQDPSGIIERNLDAISAETGIPKRELRGNAQGEQAGAEQDEKSYFGMIAERREQYASPHIVRAVIDVLTNAGVVPQPDGDYEVTWEPLAQTGASEQSKIDSNRAAVIAQVPGLAGTQALRYLKNGPEAIELPDDTTANRLPEDGNAVDAFMGLWSANADSPEDLDLTPPQAAQDAAQRALDLAEEYGREIAMTETGWSRAEQLAAGEELSPSEIADGTDGMGNWWARHASHTLSGDVTDSDAELKLPEDTEPHQDASYVAGLGWGGPVGERWATRMKERIEDLRDND